MNDARSLSGSPWRYGILAVLALVMIATRSSLLRDHLAPLPDASWPVFFIAGFHFAAASGQRLFGLLRAGGAAASFLALMALAVLIDWFVISAQGIAFWSHYCVSPAYWFLLPSYAALWLGGAWLRSHYRGLHVRELGLLTISALVAVGVCFLLSDASYYWLSDAWMANGATRSFGGWFKNFSDWYWIFTRSTLAYLAVAAVLHTLVVLAVRAQPVNTGSAQQR